MTKILPELTEHFVSRLPYWKVQTISNKLGIQCPKCGGKALVSKRWSQPRTYECHDGSKVLIIGRSCTYCMKTFQIPRSKQ